MKYLKDNITKDKFGLKSTDVNYNIESIEFGINFKDAKITKKEIKLKNDSVYGITEYDNGIIYEILIDDYKDGFIKIDSKISNKGNSDVKIDKVFPMKNTVIKSDTSKKYISSKNLVGATGLFDIDSYHQSFSFMGLTDLYGNCASLFAFLNPVDAIYQLSAIKDDMGNTIVNAYCEREGIAIKADETLNVSPLIVYVGKSLSYSLEKYGEFLKEIYDPKVSEDIMTGWCSWYYYYGQESEDDIIENMKQLSNSPLKDKIKVIQIDDGWNLPYNGHERVWGDWYPGGKFKNGMKHIADVIHEYGFMAGLWLAPFSVDIGSNLAKEHPEWLIQSDDEETLLNPATALGIYALDLTNPEALNFLKETFKRVFDEWGFDYIKIDFLEHGLMSGRRFDPTKTSAEAFRMGMEAINEAKGDKFCLNCGSPITQAIGLCDGMRIGYDVGSRWYVPMNTGAWPYGNCSIKSAAFTTIYRQWMHGKLWQNDPDCIVARDIGCQEEINMFTDMLGEKGLSKESFGLSNEEASFWARLVWFTGSMNLLSDVWDNLSKDRQDLVLSTFPINKQKIKLVDYYEDNEFAIMMTKEGKLIVGLFNMSENDKEICMESSKFGINKWDFIEKISGEHFTGKGDLIEFPKMPKRSSRIWMLK